MHNSKDSILSSGIGMTTATVLILLCLEDIASLHRSRGRFCPDLFFFFVILITCLLGEDFISKISPFKSITVSYERANYPFLA